MKLGSLFDGSGGFPLAGSLCGIEPVWASEVEPYPIAVTKSRFPKMKHLGNICNINGAEIEPVDIITFGSPCQDLSVAGKRAGLKHEANGDEETTRSGLFMEAVRIIKEMRSATNGRYPTFALWENVPGAFSSNQGEDFRIVLEELIKIVEPTAVMPGVPKNGWAYADCYRGAGYSLAYRVLDAQYWGVPQRRRRIHLVVDFRGERAREVLFKPESLRGYFTEGRTPWQGSAGNAQNCAGAADQDGESAGGDGGRQLDAVAYTLKVRSGLPVYSIENHPADSRVDIDESGKCQTLTSRMGTGGGNVPMVMEQEIYCIDGDKIGKAERSGGSGLGIREGDKMYTLTAKDAGTHGVAYSMETYHCQHEEEKTPTLKARDFKDPNVVCYAIDRAFFNQGANAQYAPQYYTDGTVPTLVARGPSAVCHKQEVRYIVRRLTPTECARLQGFPDKWGHPDPKTDLTDEEYAFWTEVRATHAVINGKEPKTYSKEQILKWYNGLHTDSAEYKMWGNGIALPPAFFCMQGMAEALELEEHND